MEKRHIEIEVVKVNDNKVTFKIVKQSHREYGFCQQSNHNKFIASNGYKLVSVYFPSFSPESHELFCQGDLGNYDDDEVDCNVEDFAKICEAITEYNTTDGKGYEKPWPQWDDRYYFVSECGEVENTCFMERGFDYNLQEIGNFYRTFAEASKVAEKIKLLFKNSQ